MTCSLPLHIASVVLALLLLSASAVYGADNKEVATLPNSDIMLNSYGVTVYRTLVNTPPAKFDPVAFTQSVYQLVSTSNNKITREEIELIEWCGWPNTTLIAAQDYCSMGSTANASDRYVLCGFRVAANSADISKIDFASLGVLGGKVYLAMPNPAIYDGEKHNPGGDLNFVETIMMDSVAYWAIFGCILFVILALLIGGACLCCYRDRKRAASNHSRVRNTVDQYKRDVSRSSSSRNAQQQQQNTNNTVAQRRYEVYSQRGEDSDGEHTSHASAYWPSSNNRSAGGSPAAAPNVARADNDHVEREMSEKMSSSKYQY